MFRPRFCCSNCGAYFTYGYKPCVWCEGKLKTYNGGYPVIPFNKERFLNIVGVDRYNKIWQDLKDSIEMSRYYKMDEENNS